MNILLFSSSWDSGVIAWLALGLPDLQDGSSRWRISLTGKDLIFLKFDQSLDGYLHKFSGIKKSL